MKDDGQGVTSYQCPDCCGQARTGKECEGCVALNDIRKRAKGLWKYFDLPRLLSAFDFQKARAEEAEGDLEKARENITFQKVERVKDRREINRLREEIERHKRDTEYAASLGLTTVTSWDKGLWATLEPPEGEK